MTGETDDKPSGWTVDTLKAHFEQRLRDLESRLEERYATQTKAMETALAAAQKAVETAMTSAEKAVTKAEMANEKRFEAANEWRGQSADRERSQQEQLANLTATLLPREVAEPQFNELRKIAQTALDTAKAAESKATGHAEAKAGLSMGAGLVIACGGVFVGLIGLVVAALSNSPS